MQIDLVPLSFQNHGADPLPIEGKGKSPAPQPVSVPDEPAAPRHHAEVAHVPLPAPDRVTVAVDPTRELVYRFLDPKTGEVVSQIPPEQVLEIVRGIQALLRNQDRSEVPTVNVRG